MSDYRNASAAALGTLGDYSQVAGGPPPLARAPDHKLFLLRGVEQGSLRFNSFVDRAGDAIARWAGDARFFAVHAIAYAAWMVVNSGAVPGVPAFDPYPFGFLGLIMALEVSCLSTAVLMRQNRQSQQADQRALLDLQVNLLAEQEATRMLHLLQAVCAHLGLEKSARDRDPTEMARIMSRASLNQDLKRAQIV